MNLSKGFIRFGIVLTALYLIGISAILLYEYQHTEANYSNKLKSGSPSFELKIAYFTVIPNTFSEQYNECISEAKKINPQFSKSVIRDKQMRLCKATFDLNLHQSTQKHFNWPILFFFLLLLPLIIWSITLLSVFAYQWIMQGFRAP